MLIQDKPQIKEREREQEGPRLPSYEAIEGVGVGGNTTFDGNYASKLKAIPIRI